MAGRETNDGKWADFGSDGRVESINGESVDRGLSGTTCWDKDGKRSSVECR